MRDLIIELRRRGVFRAAGIYVAAAWILIEGASVILPNFDVSDAAMRWLVIAAFVGFPIAVALAWIFDLTEQGLQRTDDVASDTQQVSGVQKGDFLAISGLSIALIFSMYLNIRSEPISTTLHETQSIIIADFDNRTNDLLIGRVLQHAVTIDIERTPFISSYDRNVALSLDSTAQATGELTVDTALSIASSQAIDFGIYGSVEAKGTGYKIAISVIDVALGENVFETSSVSKTAADVFDVVAELAAEIREELGDDSIAMTDTTNAESFFAASLEAAQHYVSALDFAAGGKNEMATQSFRDATVADPDFGQAYAAWALHSQKFGSAIDTQQLWERAAAKLNKLTERERLRVLGEYHLQVTRDAHQAVDVLEELVAKYPADATGYERLATAAFQSLEFGKAEGAIELALAIYPHNAQYRASRARYSVYSGSFGVAEKTARDLVEEQPDNTAAYSPLAIAALARDDFDAARDAYRQLAESSDHEHYASKASLGLIDIEIYSGALDTAANLLRSGIDADLSNNNLESAAYKYLVLAEMLLAQGDIDGAKKSADRAFEISDNEALSVALAVVYFQTGSGNRAEAISTKLQLSEHTQLHAYGLMLRSIQLRNDDSFSKSINTMRDALKVADLWLIRFQLAQTYLRTEQFAEALDEFTIIEQRRGEASAAFFDDKPTYRYLATLPYWIGRAQDGLNMHSAAAKNYQAFLARWSDTGPLSDDSRNRLESEVQR